MSVPPQRFPYQVNFFLEFDICFFRSQSIFEVRPKP
jgi:hypothetical protein